MTLYSEKLSINYSNNRKNFTATDEDVFNLLEQVGIKGKDILDFGCGDGVYSFKLKKLGAKSVIGIDVSPTMIKLANESLAETKEKIRFIEADGVNLPLENNSFDIVFANFVFHHFSDSSKPISEIFRVLRSGGYFLCTFSAYEIVPGFENLINTDIPIRLGHGDDSIVVQNFVKPKEEICNNIVESGFEIVNYDSVANPNANIDFSYQHKDEVKKLTIISLAKKI